MGGFSVFKLNAFLNTLLFQNPADLPRPNLVGFGVQMRLVDGIFDPQAGGVGNVLVQVDVGDILLRAI